MIALLGPFLAVNPEHVTRVEAIRNGHGDIRWVRVTTVDGGEIDVPSLGPNETAEEKFGRVCILLRAAGGPDGPGRTTT